MKVKDVTTRKVLSVKPTASVLQAVRVMLLNKIRGCRWLTQPEPSSAIDGTEMDRRSYRCVSLRGKFRRLLRDRFFAAKEKRDGTQIPGAVHMAAASGKGFSGFLS